MKPEDTVFQSHWPEGLKNGEFYTFLCDDNGRNGGTWLKVMVAPADSDVHVSMMQWEDMKNGKPDPFPSVRCRTVFGGGRHHRTKQALLWLAQAIRLDNEDIGR